MSVTVQMTALGPTRYGSVASLVTLATAQLSLVLAGIPKSTPLAVHKPASVLTVTLAGQLIAGAWLSTTITCCVQVALLPWMSVTVQITALVPTGYGSVPSLLTLATAQLSFVLAGTPKFTPLAEHKPASVLTVT